MQEEASAARKQRKALFAADWSLEMDPVRSVDCWSIAADPTLVELHRSVIVVRKRGDLASVCSSTRQLLEIAFAAGGNTEY